MLSSRGLSWPSLSLKKYIFVRQKIKSLTNKRVNRSAAACGTRMGHSYLSDPEAQSHRWAEYFEELLTPAADAADFSLLDHDEKVLSRR